MTIRTVLISIQAMLGQPEADDPQDAVVASQYKSNREMFDETARLWAVHFASGLHSCIIPKNGYPTI